MKITNLHCYGLCLRVALPALCAFAVVFLAATAFAQRAPEKVLPVLGRIAADGTSVTLSWREADPPRAGSVTVKRRVLGQTGAGSWEVIGSNLGAVFEFTDTTTSAGTAFEYRVERRRLQNGDLVDLGFWLAGVDVPAPERRGTAILVIDETWATDLGPRLDRFELDLLGDGWDVVRLVAPRGAPGDTSATLVAAAALKEQIAEIYWQDPFGGHALVLIGHVPLVRSGHAAPDGHKRIALGTDLYYADMEGNWPALEGGWLVPNSIPSGRIAMPVGRIDFRGLGKRGRAGERDLLRAYFDRNHAWRHGLIGDLRQAYWANKMLRVERNGVRNIVGPESVSVGAHGSLGQWHPWLFGVDFGLPGGAAYAERFSSKPVFAINFGSHKQKIHMPRNAMNALLAQPFYPLAVGWGGRPAWWLHLMALGQSMGEVQLRTVNNGALSEPYPDTMEYLPTGNFIWRNPIWVNLLGDPTVHPFPVAPPRDFRARRRGDSVVLTWQPSSEGDLLGYRVLRAEKRSGPYTRVTKEPVTESTFIDSRAGDESWYMLRSIVRKSVHAGSILALSQGQFATLDTTPVAAPDLNISSPPEEPVAVFLQASSSEGSLMAPARGAENAALNLRGDQWVLEPMAGFHGTISFPYFASDGLSTASGTVRVDVGSP